MRNALEIGLAALTALGCAATASAAVAACGAGSPKPAETSQPAPTQIAAPTTATANPDPKICRQVEVTGSRLSQKECHTASEWAAIQDQGRDSLANRAQRQLSGHTLGAGPN